MSLQPGPASVPVLPRGVRLRHDAARGGWTLLAPERIVNPDQIAHATLALVDGQRDLGTIAQILSREYAADIGEIFGDITELVVRLRDRGLLGLRDPGIVGLVAHARVRDMYSNLITSGVGLRRDKLLELVDAGLDHLQLSIQDSTAQGSDHISGRNGSLARKLEVAAWCRDTGIAFTLNAVVHRHNIHHIIELALGMGAGRLEIAHVQYHGWALLNRTALMPTHAQVLDADARVHAARARLAGRLLIDYVAPDYYSDAPKACMGGWGAADADHRAGRAGDAVPRRQFHPRYAISARQRAFAALDLDILRCIRTLPWHVLDARTLCELRTA